MSNQKGKNVCILGSGKWGTAIAKIVGKNVKKYTELNNVVNMYFYNEMLGDGSSVDQFNETHENVKYLPNSQLPKNVRAIGDLRSTKDADIIIFVVPLRCIKNICATLMDIVKKTAIALSLVKGFLGVNGNIKFISGIISKKLKIPCSVLVCAHLPWDTVNYKYGESFLGCNDKKSIILYKKILETTNFKILPIEEVETVEICGALRTLVSCAVGIAQGLKYGVSTNCVAFRLGLSETMKFIDIFHPNGTLYGFLQCCVSNFVLAINCDRNINLGKAFVKHRKPITELEQDFFPSQKLQGPFVAREVNNILKFKGLEEKFPLFTAIYKIFEGEDPEILIESLRNFAPHYMYIPKHLVFIPSG